MLSVTPYYNRPNRRGIKAPLRGGRAGHRQADRCSTTSPRARRRTCRPTCSPSSRRSTASTGVKQANDDELAPIDGLDVYAGDDGTFARTLDFGGAGGILVASHIVGDEMRRMVDEPEQPRRDRRVAARRLRDALHDRQPDLHEGRAEHARPDAGGSCGCRWCEATDGRARRRARDARAPRPAWRPPPVELDPCASCRSAAWARSART